MLKKYRTCGLLFAYATLCSQSILAQEVKKISLQEVISLAEKNNPSLLTLQEDIRVAQQNVEVAKTNMLPNISAGVQGFYLGDAYILDKNFSNATKVPMPHFGNNVSLSANQLLWKGGTVRNGIKIQELRRDLSELNFDNIAQSVKQNAVSNYLDLYKLQNQETIYLKNIELAEKRLENINKFYKQGMITRNDIMRAELQLSNFNMALQVVRNNKAILSKQLATSLGIDGDVEIQPDPQTVNLLTPDGKLQEYRDNITNHPLVKMANKSVEIYDTSAKITKAERLPSIGAFASDNLQRPITTSRPAMDMYSNGFSAGLSINYNIDALYKTSKKLELNRYEKDKALAQARETEKMLDVAITASYIKLQEAKAQSEALQKNVTLAQENYRILESKYNNQLSILLDLIDASNLKLDAELQYINSEINIINAYYKLLKDSGEFNSEN